MTAQIAEKLIYRGAEVSMCSEPLGVYFAFGGKNPGFESNCTALWRGYIGTWEITNDRLYLIELAGTLSDGTEANLNTVFAGYPERVFAHWYSGTLRIPEGKLLEYVHMGFASTYERDCIIRIEKGVVVEATIYQNGTAENRDAPEGYDIWGMTIFPRNARPEDGSE